MNHISTTRPVFKIRASALGDIMSDPQGGSPMDRYLKKQEEIREEQAKYDAYNDKNNKTADKKWLKILKLQDDLNELEQHKDDIHLSETCKKHLEDWVKEHYYGRRKQLKTNAIQKGIECENEAVFVLNKALGTNYVKANNHLENERCTGHEDIDGGDHIIDTKVCESFDTFPILVESLDKAYRWQGQAYMRLKGEQYKYHIVAKVLVNSPAWQIDQKLYHAYSNLERKYAGIAKYIDEEYAKEERQIFLGHVFDKQITVVSNGKELQLTDEEVIPADKRVNLIKFDREDVADRIIERVLQCRQYLKQLGYHD